MSKARKWLVPAAVVAALAVGYFAGREHVKWQVRQGIREIGKNLPAGP